MKKNGETAKAGILWLEKFDEAIVELQEVNKTIGEMLIERNNLYIKIAELEEAMKPKTCDGCKHLVLGINSCGSTMDCKKGFKCSRVFKDEFELKDNK